MRFVTADDVHARFAGKTVAIVGSGPTVLENEPGFIDSHDVVVRVNNYKLSTKAGRRADVHYSFYGRSIRKTAEELRTNGVTLCMCKCPDDMPITCDWHVQHGKYNGIDFRYIYRMRSAFWFCDTYVPSTVRFLEKFFLLDRHVPTTGFAAIHDVLMCNPKQVYLTGFDFFMSRKHNVTDRWNPGNPADPIGHRPDLEAKWLAANLSSHPIQLERTLAQLLVNPELINPATRLSRLEREQRQSRPPQQPGKKRIMKIKRMRDAA